MGGMEMLMKSFGLDPAEIQNQVKKAGEDFKAVVKHFDTRMDVVEKTLARIDANQLKIMACLKIESVVIEENALLEKPPAENRKGS